MPTKGTDELESLRTESISNRQYTQGAIEALREKLLDLTRRNATLNFRHSDRSRTHIRVIDEIPDFLFEFLLAGNSLVFKPLPEPEDIPKDEQTSEFQDHLDAARLADPEYRRSMDALDPELDNAEAEWLIERALRDQVRKLIGLSTRVEKDMQLSEYARALDLEPSYDLPDPAESVGDQEKHSDRHIQTLLFPDAMERKLSAIYQQALSALQEMGVNTLFIAFGFLEWKESPTSQQKQFSPLLFLPVEMERKRTKKGYQFAIRAIEEEPTINLSLKVKLRREFGIELPEFELGSEENETRDTIEAYWRKVSVLTEYNKGWQVRRFVTVGHFAFSRLVMYEDLDASRWREGTAPADHSVVSDLILGSKAQDGKFLVADEYEVDDDNVTASVPLIITDADSSQFSAIVDVLNYKNLVIKGPPGTGKSQTITNIIGAALAANKRVLFVAEKAAALEVVSKRLTDARLGEFCLQLHSTRASKPTILKSLRDRDELPRQIEPEDLAATIKALRKVRDYLNGFVKLLNQPYGDRGETLQQTIWQSQQCEVAATHANVPNEVYRWVIPDALSKDLLEIENIRSNLDLVQKTSQAIVTKWTSVRSHPWWGVTATAFSVFDQEESLRDIVRWLAILDEIQSGIAELDAEMGLRSPNTVAALNSLVLSIGRLPAQMSGLDSTLLARIGKSEIGHSIEERIDLLLQFTGQICQLSDLEQVLNRCFDDLELAASYKERIAELASSIRNHAPAKMMSRGAPVSVGALNEEAHVFEASAKRLRLIDAFAGQIFRFVSETIEPDIEAVGQIAGLLTKLANVDRSALLYRTDITADETQHPILYEAARHLSEIRTESEELSQQYHFTYKSDYRAYYNCARTIRSKGIFGRCFGKEYRNAKQIYAEATRHIRKATADEMAFTLEKIGLHLERTTLFLQNESFQRVAGPYWSGIDTPFEELVNACDYTKLICFSCAGFHFELSKIIQKFCLGASLEQVVAFVSLAKRPEFQQLMSQVEACAIDGMHQQRLAKLADCATTNAEFLSGVSRALLKMGVRKEAIVSDLIQAAPMLQERAVLKGRVQENSAGRDLIDPHIRGTEVDLQSINSTIEIARVILREISHSALRDWLLCSGDYFLHLGKLQKYSVSVEDRLNREIDARQVAISRAKIDCSKFFGCDTPAEMPVSDIFARIKFAHEHHAHLHEWLTFNRSLSDAQGQNMRELFDIYDGVGANYTTLVIAFDCAFYRSLMREAFQRHPELIKFAGVSQEEARERFCQLDKRVIHLQRQVLRSKLWHSQIPRGLGRGPKKHWTELSLIRNEYQKQKRIVPIRTLMSRASAAIQAMKPCFMMSPSSVAQYLEPGKHAFDLVVIDEASQMKPEEAIGAITRGKQLVVVGDPLQLPPTDFFEKAGRSADEESEEYDDVDIESILDQALGVFHPVRDLRWHYRSRHESLISFSNRHFYDDRLIVFPNPTPKHPDLGVRHVFVDNPAYKGGLNEPEAKRVVDIAISFMQCEADKPRVARRSVGIATMNIGQRDLVQEMLNRRTAADDRANEYVSGWEDTLEPVFVKNLENVQGDERDVIIISTVYGPERPGVPPMQRFGPVNGKAGHRRLNVLFTRAKDQVILVTSLRSMDIVIGERTHQGVGILKRYLQYAETGRLEFGRETFRETESPFEDFVKRQLESHGFDVVPQVGVSGYRIDLAVRHPENPDHFILGIECDGASYHSAKSARDRDRIREAVITNLGWRLHRIWSLDWFRDRDREMTRLLSVLREAISEEGSLEEEVETREEDITTATIDVDATEVAQSHASRIDVTDHIRDVISRVGQRVEIVYEDGTQSKGRLIGHKGNRVVVLQLLENDRIIKPALDHVKLLFEDGYVWQPEFAIPEPMAVVRESEVHNPTIGTNLSVDQARNELIRLREIIQSEFSDADRSRGLLRKEMLRHFLSKKPITHDDFRNSFPLQLREKTDSRQMRYLKDIFEIIDEMEA